MEVPMTRTPLSERSAAELFCSSYERLYGALPDPRLAAFALAITWIETGHGYSIHNYNLGNIIATSPSQPHWVPPWVDDPTHALHDKPNVPTMFRAYQSFDQGAERQWKTLFGPRYRSAMQLTAESRFFDAYKDLVRSGYCPDPQCHSDAAARNVESFAEGFLRDRLFEDVCGASLPIGPSSSRGRKFFDNPLGALLTVSWIGTVGGLAWRAYA